MIFMNFKGGVFLFCRILFFCCCVKKGYTIYLVYSKLWNLLYLGKDIGRFKEGYVNYIIVKE